MMAQLAPAISRSGVPSPISLPLYIRRVHRLRQLLDSVSVNHSHGVSVIGRHMESLGRVRIGDGRAITTPLPDWGRQLLSANTTDIQSVDRKLDTLDRALHAIQPQRWQPARLRQLDRVLRDPRFHPHLNPLQTAEAWLGDRLAQLVWFLSDHVSFGVPNGHPIVTAFVALVFLLLVASIAMLIGRTAIRRSAASIPAREIQAEVANPRAARQRAAELAAGGSYREAFRYLFLATLLELRDKGLLQLRPGDTNREYAFSLDTIPGTARQREALVALVDEFDRVWYGHQALTCEQYERCVALATQIIEPAIGARTG